MKTPQEWQDYWAHQVPDELELIKAIQADAREQGRREGLEEAAEIAEDTEHCPLGYIGEMPSDAIRKLLEKPGGG